MSRGGKVPELHAVDGKQMTVDEIAAMLGCTKGALYLRRSRLGGISYQLVVDMWRRGQIGNNHCFRYLIDGKWLTLKEIAAALKLSNPHTLTTWRSAHRKPDGTPASMEDAIAYYRQYLTGELKRGGKPGVSGRHWKEYLVNGKVWTVRDVARRYGLHIQTVHNSLHRYGHDMGRVLEFYGEKERRQKALEEKRRKRAERKLMKILGY